MGFRLAQVQPLGLVVAPLGIAPSQVLRLCGVCRAFDARSSARAAKL